MDYGEGRSPWQLNSKFVSMDVELVTSLLRDMSESAVSYVLLSPFDENSGDVDVLLEPKCLKQVWQLALANGLVLLWRRKRFYHEQLVFAYGDNRTFSIDAQSELLYRCMKLDARSAILAMATMDNRGVMILPDTYQFFTLLLHCIVNKGELKGGHLAVHETYALHRGRCLAIFILWNLVRGWLIKLSFVVAGGIAAILLVEGSLRAIRFQLPYTF